MLLSFVTLYLLITVAIGIFAARRVKTSSDYAVAGRKLPLIMIITTTFATWFGAETVLGISAKFVQSGLGGVVEDPFGAGICLILVGLFFAPKLYKLNLLTISEFFRNRYGKKMEVLCSIAILVSYFGWVAAQIVALGLVFNLLSDRAISVELGMFLGISAVLAYTVLGGMWSVAITDFIQMTIMVIGLLIVAYFITQLTGGVAPVLKLAEARELTKFWPEPKFHDVIFFIAAGVTLMFGSIPQQDVFQRVMSAKTSSTATRGAVLGGIAYILFAFVPMYLVLAAVQLHPQETDAMLNAGSSQEILPLLVLNNMPLPVQVIFFGALLSAIMSTASATLLAPSLTFVENIWSNFRPIENDVARLRAMRIALVLFSVLILCYAIASRDTSIYELVSSAYQVTLVAAFVPLLAGLWWRRASNTGGLSAIGGGLTVWLIFQHWAALGEIFPAQLAGLIAAAVGMIVGSLIAPRTENAARPAPNATP